MHPNNLDLYTRDTLSAVDYKSIDVGLVLKDSN